MSSDDTNKITQNAEEPKVAPQDPKVDATSEMDLAVEHARRRYTAGRGWKATAVVTVVALGGFAAGTYWGRDALRLAGVSSLRREDGQLVAAMGPTSAPAVAANDNTGDGVTSLWTCSMHPQVIQPQPGICPICHMELTPLRSDGAGSATVTIDPVIVQNMGVRTAEVHKGPLIQSVRVVGYLEEPEPLHRDINLRVNGWLEKLYANIDGMIIQDGQPLFDLYSPELTVAIDEMISAAKQLKIAPDDETSKALIDASRRKLLQYGLTEKQVTDLGQLDAAPQIVSILSPMGGHLTAKMVYEGAAVKSGDLVLRIASRHRMWIDAQVHEQQMPLLSDGQGVRATLVSQPGKVYNGKLLFVHPHLDPKTRTALARIEIDNQDLHLRQGMYATVEILADDYREATVVPREAVIDTGRRQMAFVDVGDGRFEPRELKLGLSGQGDTVEVLEGVTPGERVVTSGQFLLDSESRLKEAVAKHLSGGLGGHASGASAPAKTALPSPAASVTKVTVPHTDDIVTAYLTLAKKLGERQAAETPVDPAPLADVAAMAAGHSSGQAKALAQSVSAAAEVLKGKPIAEQRKGFLALSDAIVALVRASTPSESVAPMLFVMHCPMAFEDKGADWLQDAETVANPYYASAMKRCGEVREQITTQKK